MGTYMKQLLLGISRSEIIQFCAHCRRYNRPPWVLCERESKELHSICLKLVKGYTIMNIYVQPTASQIDSSSIPVH